MATRGSFESKQAIEGTKMIRDSHDDFKDGVFQSLTRGLTPLYEIIYPENKIVVDYGNERDLIYFTTVYNNKDKDFFDTEMSLLSSSVKVYDGIKDINKMKKMEDDLPGQEGFVVKFDDGSRCKVKFDEYCRLHRLITGVNKRYIWKIKMYEVNPDKYVEWKGDINKILDNVPDEFYNWVKSYLSEISRNFEYIKGICEEDYFHTKQNFETRKDKALYFKDCKYPSVLFCMLDGKDYNEIIYKMLEPKNDINVFKIDADIDLGDGD